MIASLSLLSLVTLHREGKLLDVEPSLLESIVCRALDTAEDVTSIPRSLRRVILATKTPQARRLAARLIEEWVIDHSLEHPPPSLLGKGWWKTHRRHLSRRGARKPLKHGFQMGTLGPASIDYKLTFYWFGKKHGLAYYEDDIDPSSEVWYKHGVRDGIMSCAKNQHGELAVSIYSNGELMDRLEAGPDESAGNYQSGEWLRDAIADVAYSIIYPPSYPD